MIARISLIFLFLVSSSVAAPFPLTSPSPGPAGTLHDPLIGVSSEGFILAGSSIWGIEGPHPAFIPLDAAARPRVETPIEFALPSVSKGRPVFVGGRWLLFTQYAWSDLRIDQFRADGSPAGPTVRFTGIDASIRDVAWNGRRLAIVFGGLEDQDAIVIRTLPADLSSISAPRPTGGRGFTPRIAGTPSGFAILWRTMDPAASLTAMTLNDDGDVQFEPVVVSSAPHILGYDVAGGSSAPLLVWVERMGTIRAATIEESTVSATTVAVVQDADALPNGRWVSLTGPFLHPVAGGFLIAWQEAAYDRVFHSSHTLRARRLALDGSPAGAMTSYQIPFDATLIEIGESSGGTFAFFERSSTTTAKSHWAMRLVDAEPAVLHPLTLRLPETDSLELTSIGPANVFGVWVERDAVESHVRAGIWDREGKRIGERLVGTARPWVNADTAPGAGRSIVVWADGLRVYACFVSHDSLEQTSPVVLAAAGGDDLVWLPRVTWDGSRFIATWLEGKGMRGAVVGDTVEPFGVLLPRPEIRTPSLGESSRRTAGIAATRDSIVTLQRLQEGGWCSPVGMPCTPLLEVEELTRFDRAGRLLERHVRPALPHANSSVATDGTDFVIAAETGDGISVRTVSGETGAVSSEHLVFEHPYAFRPFAVWEGTHYVVLWSYATPGQETGVAVALLDRAGKRVGPIRTGVSRANLSAAPLAGDILLGGVVPLPFWPLGTGSRAIGEFHSSLGELTIRPLDAPVITSARIDGSGAELDWEPVPGATGYYVQTLNVDRQWSRQSLGAASGGTTTTFYSVIFHEPIVAVRIFAVNDGGASKPVVIEGPLSARRRVAWR